MSKIGNYIAWCEDNGYTDEYGEVTSMEYANEYMKTKEYLKEHNDFSKLLVENYVEQKDAYSKWIQENM